MLEPVLGEGRQISVVDPASEIVPHMPCVNELVGGTAIWQEPSRFPLPYSGEQVTEIILDTSNSVLCFQSES